MTVNLLEVKNLQMRFGGINALSDVSFSIAKGSITSLIGPNGAGKTTMFNCITGMYLPTSGSVTYDGIDITGRKAHEISRHGIARTFQNLALFSGLTVLENLVVGNYRHGTSGLLHGALGIGRTRAERRHSHKQAMAVLDFIGMPEVAQMRPTELPYGKQKQVEFARALMQKANLVMLDEPMAGMGDAEKAELTLLIERVRETYGVTFLLVEHDIPVVMSMSDKIVVLDFGRKIGDGIPSEVQANPDVIAAYLGSS